MIEYRQGDLIQAFKRGLIGASDADKCMRSLARLYSSGATWHEQVV